MLRFMIMSSHLFDLLSPAAWLLAVGVVLLTGISKAGFGGALGGVAVPLLSMLVPAPVAAALLLPVLYAVDWLGIRVFWKHFDRQEMRNLLPAAAVGVVIGSLCLGLLDPRWIRLAVGVISIGIAINRFMAKKPENPGPGRALAWFWAGTSGLTSTLAHAGGPPLFAYLSGRRMEPLRFVATASSFFFVVNLLKAPAYLGAGLLKPQLLLHSLILMPLVPLGIMLGRRLQQRLEPKMFERVFTYILLATGVQLVVASL